MVKLGAIILAAGQSQRYGRENKLIADYKGKPLLDYALSCVSALPLAEKIVVSGYDSMKIKRRAELFNMQCVYNSEYESGMGPSIATGIAGLSEELDAYFIFLGDLPKVNARLCLDVMAAYSRSDRASIIRPMFEEQSGHPVIIPAKFREDLLRLNQDVGLRNLVQNRNIPIVHTRCSDGACLADIDTPEDPPS